MSFLMSNLSAASVGTTYTSLVKRRTIVPSGNESLTTTVPGVRELDAVHRRVRDDAAQPVAAAGVGGRETLPAVLHVG